MITGLRPYSKMTETGLPWVPAIPAHWVLQPNWTLMKFKKDILGERHSEYSLLSLTKAGVIVRDVSTGRGKFSADMGTSQEVCPGDLIFCLFDVPETPRTVGRSKHRGMITGAYSVFEPIAQDYGRFVEAFYIAMDDRKLLSPLYSGLRNTIPPSRFQRIKTPIPPLDEQRLIVRFLDWHGAMTGKLIRAKRRLIALLNEQKQSIIHRAVTRGLDPAAKLKPSGVDWLGDVPEHWEVKRLKFACQVNPRTSAPSADVQTTFLPMENVSTTGQVDYSIQRPTADVSTGYTPFMQGDVILAKITPCFENGKGALLCDMPTAVGYGSTEFIVLRPMPGLLADYAYLLTVDPAFRLRGTEAMTGSAGQQRVSPDFVANWIIGLPSETEQRAICAHVRDHTAEFDVAIHKVQSEIKFIQEFRTRLIADVVTGQLDVRAVAANLPDVVETDAADLTDDDDLDDDADDLIDEEEAT